ncbi:MAG TPA: phosphoenolpyruvate--protein phosphotransferase, partial [Candidatus Acidoferrum sp.]|nr:phosphoenolpyruvate--protein phosphotransferase [Candidatus Acidoferrum sp.]
MQAVPAAPGIARGPWIAIRRASTLTGGTIDAAETSAEQGRLRDAANRAADDLLALSDKVAGAGHGDEAGIFAAQAAMCWDPELLRDAEARIADKGVDGVAAILGAGAAAAEHLAAVDDPLIAARSADVLDVADRIARVLAGRPAQEARLREPSIVVAVDLSPSQTATLPRDRILGIVLEAGSPTAHAAILARAYGIPAVVGATGALELLEGLAPGVQIAFDGATGEIAIDPDEATTTDIEERAARFAAIHEHDLEEASLSAVTIDGTEITLLANIGTPDEAANARAMGARGVGLFRTEFLFLERSSAPSEDEQEAAYRRAVEAFDGDPVTIRLLDVGGDKPIPYLLIPAEDNPFLGVRALRLAGSRPEIFRTQLRACYRAATAGRVKIMAPMVADSADAATLLVLAADARASLEHEGMAVGNAQLGVMLEIPSAILSGPSWFGDVAFASLGTNDLTQYTLAVDRGNPALERYRDSLHP